MSHSVCVPDRISRFRDDNTQEQCGVYGVYGGPRRRFQWPIGVVGLSNYRESDLINKSRGKVLKFHRSIIYKEQVTPIFLQEKAVENIEAAGSSEELIISL
jgi:hypothetical protein